MRRRETPAETSRLALTPVLSAATVRVSVS
jgi:hypothetical protein